MLTLILDPLVEASLNILDCRDFMNNSVVFRVPEQICFRGGHIGPAAFAIIVLLLLLLITPLSQAIALGIMWKKGQIDYNFDERKHDASVEMRRTLYEQYRPQYFFMEPVISLERGLIIVLFAELGFTSGYNYLIYASLFAILCLTRQYIQPYKEIIEAYLEREMLLGWIAILAFRLASFNTSENNVVPYVIVVMFLPVALHV
ncbi:hypothetical protein HDU67_005800, partial [Dinochytrium kinnereticum]